MKIFQNSILAMATLVFAFNCHAQSQSIVQTAVGSDDFNTLVAAVKAAGLVDTLNSSGPYTVFAPTDAAFESLAPGTVEFLLQPENKQQLIDILKYHVVSGSVKAKDAFPLRNATTLNGQRVAVDFNVDQLMINDARIVTADIPCTNGVIHVIDRVLLPKTDRIPAVALEANSFNTLLAAVGAAGLGEVLGSDGPFTVFAPTDEAFSALPDGTVETLLEPKNKKKLTDILKYHVVAGRVYSADAIKAERASTLLGPSVSVSLNADGTKVNEANLVSADLETANGVIHVIDAVLLPQSPSPTDVKNMIQDAISKGAPIYNSGHHKQCGDIYMSTLNSIMASGVQGADDHLMTSIQNSLRNARRTHNDSQRAWALRRGMEQVYVRMNQMPMSAQIGN